MENPEAGGHILFYICAQHIIKEQHGYAPDPATFASCSESPCKAAIPDRGSATLREGSGPSICVAVRRAGRPAVAAQGGFAAEPAPCALLAVG